MKQIILMTVTALFCSAGIMAQDASVTLRAAFDVPSLLTASPDSIIHYDENDKKSAKEENVFNENNFVSQTNHYIWNGTTNSWKPDGKSVNTLDSKGRPTTTIGYSATGVEESKEDMSYEGDNNLPKTVTTFTKEEGSWISEGTINFTKAETNSAGQPTLLEGSMEAEGMALSIKIVMTYDGNINYTTTTILMGGTVFQTVETKGELVSMGNPTITKSYTKENGAWKYNGQDHAYFSDHEPGGSTANETITAEKPEWRLNGTILEVPAAENGIKIYTIVGHLVKESCTSTIDVSTLTQGVYIVQTDKGSFKIRF